MSAIFDRLEYQGWHRFCEQKPSFVGLVGKLYSKKYYPDLPILLCLKQQCQKSNGLVTKGGTKFLEFLCERGVIFYI